MGQVEHHAVAIAKLDGDGFGARRGGIDVAPRIDMGSDVVSCNDHAMIGDFFDAILIDADASRHIPMALHFHDDGLDDVRIGHHPLVDFHAEIDQFDRHWRSLLYLPTHPPSTWIDWPVRSVASSEAKNAGTVPISRGSPARPSEICARMPGSRSGRFMTHAVMSVSINPGWTQFT